MDENAVPNHEPDLASLQRYKHEEEKTDGRRLDATSDVTIPPGGRVADRVAGRGVQSGLAPDPILRGIAGMPGLSLRASSLVTAAVLLRVVGYDQLRRLAYVGLDASAVRRDVREAEDAGWLQRWSLPIRGYGRVGHVHPTERANAAVLGSVHASTADASWGKTVQLMLPATGRRSLTLSSVPKWFQHQREVNHLLTSIVCSRRAPLLWASAWDSPFPTRVGGVTMPQPDYVLVEADAGGPRVVFGEHDRGHEPIERFVARKVALYAGLSGACASTLGVPSFRVDVSVIDTVSRHPIERLRRLMEATRAYGAADLFRFTLGGWLFAEAAAPIWFIDGTPQVESLRPADHESLRA
jgi:hypothetical protein